jgi:hypothetical protein
MATRVNKKMNIPDSQESWNFLTTLATTSFSRRTMLHVIGYLGQLKIYKILLGLRINLSYIVSIRIKIIFLHFLM